MSKRTIRDILPPEHKNRDRGRIKTPPIDTSVDKPVTKSPPVQKPLRPFFEESGSISNIPPRPNQRGRLRYLYYGVISIVFIALLSFLFSVFFAGATITVTPKIDTLTVDGEFRGVSKDPSTREIQYDIMTLEELLSATVPATGKVDVQEKASGNITVFNDYNDSPQRLIVNTRFETPDGLIFRIAKSITVPGKKDGVPGSIEVTIYADEPGEQYNVGLTNFTIPGFKGAPQFEGFYASSKTSMEGGFVGERLKVEESTLTLERNKLRATLEASLLDKVSSEQPVGFISFPDSIFIEFVSETPKDREGEVEIREKAVLYNVLFAEEAFAKFLAEATLGSFDGNDVTFRENINLTLIPQPLEKEESIAPWRDGEFKFILTGTADIVWLFDESALKDDLSGRNKEAIYTILSGYSSIDEAEVVIRPFWKGSFPTDTEEIKIEVLNPN